MATHTHRGLKPAHRGYQYQDLLTAQCLAMQLVERWPEVVVDKKLFANDLFDDLQIDTGGYIVRRQIKHSDVAGRKFSEGDLRNQSSPIRLDLLFDAFLGSGSAVADEYRICANWGSPDNGLDGLLVPVSAGSGTVFGVSTAQYRIDAEALWTKRSASAWTCLNDIESQSQEILFDFLAKLIIELNLPHASFDLNARDLWPSRNWIHRVFRHVSTCTNAVWKDTEGELRNGLVAGKQGLQYRSRRQKERAPQSVPLILATGYIRFATRAMPSVSSTHSTSSKSL